MLRTKSDLPQAYFVVLATCLLLALLLDLAIGMDAANPPDSVIKWLEQDRYYRWCIYIYIPILAMTAISVAAS